MCLSQYWCVLSLWYGAEMVDTICLTIYSHTGLAATQTKQSATVAIRQALLGNWCRFSGKKTIGALLCMFFFVRVCVRLSARMCIIAVSMTPCMCSARASELGSLVIEAEWMFARAALHRWALWGLCSRNLKTTSRTKWVNSVWHVFNMVTLEQAAFDWKANIQAMQIINHGKRSINYSIKQSKSRINVEKQREGWWGGGSQ